MKIRRRRSKQARSAAVVIASLAAVAAGVLVWFWLEENAPLSDDAVREIEAFEEYDRLKRT